MSAKAVTFAALGAGSAAVLVWAFRGSRDQPGGMVDVAEVPVIDGAGRAVPPYVMPDGPDPLLGGYPRARSPLHGLDLASLPRAWGSEGEVIYLGGPSR